MSLAYYTMDDLRLGRGGFLQKGWTIRQRPELGEALAHYRGMPITKRKVLGLTDGFHVLELVKNVPLFPDDPEGEDVLASELGEPLPQWADTPEACQAFRACVEDLGLRYQIEGKILAPIPVNKKQRRKKLVGEIPLARRPRQSGLRSPVGVPGREGLAGPHGARGAPCRAAPGAQGAGGRHHGQRRLPPPGAGALGVPPPGPAHSGAAGAKYDKM